MSMTVALYTNNSEINRVDKDIETLITLSGTLKEDSSIIDPVITMSDIDEYIPAANYAWIAEFERFYFITNVESIRNNLWRLTLHVDVLYTFASSIRANSALIERNENEYDLLLNDGLFKTQQNPRIAQFPFPSGFNHWNFVLAVAGN